MIWYFFHNRRLREWMNHLVLKTTSRPLEPTSEQEQALIDQLRSDFKNIGPISNETDKASEQVWVNNMNRLTQLVLNEDPRTFLHWDVIQKAMFITNAMYVLIELSFLKKQADWQQRWKQAIREDKTGAPVPYWSHPSSSGNLIHHAYHVAQFESRTGVEVSKLDFVVECGGGYGSMCRLFRNLGFRGTYVIFDLPHFSALQNYYLQSVGIRVQDHGTDDQEMAVLLTSDIDQLQKIGGTIAGKPSLFLATWSLSEMPLALRAGISPLFKRFTNLYFSYQSIFEEVNNVDYFRRLQDAEPAFNWETWEVQSLPTHYYLSGRRDKK